MSVGSNHPRSGSFSPIDEAQWREATYPLGAHRDSDGSVTFGVFSQRATRVLLEIYDAPTGASATHDIWLVQNPTDNIWRAKLANLAPNTLYAFRCWGPNWVFSPDWTRGDCAAGFVADVDADGNRFNPNKVLFDPYAREISHDRESKALLGAGLDVTVFATGPVLHRGKPRREVDTGFWAPKGILITDRTPTGERPRIPPEKAIIYEAHVRGLTAHPEASRLQELFKGQAGFERLVNIPEDERGTYLGAAKMAKYLRAFGMTTIEFLPVHETQNETNTPESPGNYWGYMTFSYFAPERRFAKDQSPGGPTREFKQMVQAFHDEGLEVYIDVVYNHTGEGGNWNQLDTTAFVSLGGFDTVEYYALTSDHYLVQGATGCGNQLNYSSPAAQNLVLDSLTYFIEEMGIDGFRFDLAPVLGRKPHHTAKDDWEGQKRFFDDHPLLLAIRNLGRKHDVEMIAEAWDIWGYQVGRFPADWGEWNGRYRDAVRKFSKGDGNTRDFVEVLNGDYENFNDQGGPQRSINFIVAHDGFTLMDLVSYNQKTNTTLTWPFGPSDGGENNNNSWDSGGDQALRRQRLRNFWVLLMFARGVPMVVAGDELGRTQNGNNNPWAIDTVATWTNYAMAVTHHPTAIPTGGGGSYHDNFGQGNCDSSCNPLFAFARFVTQLRAQSTALKQRKYADLSPGSGDDVTYSFRRTDGETTLQEGDRAVWLRVDAAHIEEHDLLLMINMFHAPLGFRVPSPRPGKEWRRMVDTAAWAEPLLNCWPMDTAECIAPNNYEVQPFAITVLAEVPIGDGEASPDTLPSAAASKGNSSLPL